MEYDNTVHVEDVMTTPLETISPGTTLQEAAAVMSDGDISALCVTDTTMGIVTSTDVLEAIAAGEDPAETTVADVMTESVETITANLSLTEAAAMMTNFGIKHLPVVDRDGDYVGMISTTDLTTALA